MCRKQVRDAAIRFAAGARRIAAREKAAGLLLGGEYSGTLIHDDSSVYDRFTLATHQQCLAHLMRRCHELFETAVAGAVRFLSAVLDVFPSALAARDPFRQNEPTAHGLHMVAGRFTSRMHRLVTPVKSHAANERLAKHRRTISTTGSRSSVTRWSTPPTGAPRRRFDRPS